MNFGLKDSDLNYIRQIVKNFPEIDDIVIFGSRAIGNYKPGSDIDICIKGKNISLDTVSKLKAALEDMGPLPYFVDIIDYNNIDNLELQKHIDEFGIILNSN
jgi:predicted nucleotidyltransferase